MQAALSWIQGFQTPGLELMEGQNSYPRHHHDIHCAKLVSPLSLETLEILENLVFYVQFGETRNKKKPLKKVVTFCTGQIRALRRRNYVNNKLLWDRNVPR